MARFECGGASRDRVRRRASRRRALHGDVRRRRRRARDAVARPVPGPRQRRSPPARLQRRPPGDVRGARRRRGRDRRVGAAGPGCAAGADRAARRVNVVVVLLGLCSPASRGRRASSRGPGASCGAASGGWAAGSRRRTRRRAPSPRASSGDSFPAGSLTACWRPRWRPGAPRGAPWYGRVRRRNAPESFRRRSRRRAAAPVRAGSACAHGRRRGDRPHRFDRIGAFAASRRASAAWDAHDAVRANAEPRLLAPLPCPLPPPWGEGFCWPNRNALTTTSSELADMPSAAAHGGTRPAAASGTARTL